MSLLHDQTELKDFSNKVFCDQLLRLLSDNQVFLNKVQKSQWNYSVFTEDQYDALINLLFNCAEKIAREIRMHKGFVTADMEIYLNVTGLREELEALSEMEIRKDIVQSHAALLDYVACFLDDSLVAYELMRKRLIAQLHHAHLEIFRMLEELIVEYD